MPAVRIAAPFVVDAVGDREAVAASGACIWIKVRQEPPNPIAIPFVSDSPSGGNEVRLYEGESYLFEVAGDRLIQPGEIVGYIRVASGTATFSQEEGLP